MITIVAGLKCTRCGRVDRGTQEANSVCGTTLEDGSTCRGLLVRAAMTKTTDDAYERAEADGVTVRTRTRMYYCDRDIGDIVHLKNRPAPLPGIITGIGIRPCGIFYNVRWGDGIEEGHFPIELQDEPEL